MLEAMSGVPAYIRNGRLDILAGNALARALFAPIFTSPARPVNAARFTFLDPAAAEFYPDWDAVADQNVATLRAEVGRNPYDKALSDLIGELSTRGDTFRQRWARHEVRRHRAGAKRLNHPLVGQMTFTYETMELAADEDLCLIVCGAAPGSPDADALNLLASCRTARRSISGSCCAYDRHVRVARRRCGQSCSVGMIHSSPMAVWRGRVTM